MGKNIRFDLFSLHSQKVGYAVFVLFKLTIYIYILYVIVFAKNVIKEYPQHLIIYTHCHCVKKQKY